MKNVVLSIGLLILFASAAMAQNEKCFNFEGGGFTDEIRLTVTGKTVKGHLSVSRTNSEMPTRMYDFTGTISKGVITMKFAGDVPAAFERNGDRMTATLTGKQLIVKVLTAGQSVYTATFRAC